MAQYNGHPSWAYWNVSLWINNDEGLYRMALSYARRVKPRRKAAEEMLRALADLGTAQTPDGASYTAANIQHAMRGM